VEIETSNLVDRLIVASTSLGQQTVPERGVVRSREPYIIWCEPTISLEWLELVVKFCTQVGYVKSHHNDDKTQRHGQSRVTHSKLFGP